MALKGLVGPQGCPWSLLGSEAANRPGRRVVPSRATGLYRVLDLEETGKVPLYRPTLVLFTWHCAGQKQALCELQHPHTGLLSFHPDASTSQQGKSEQTYSLVRMITCPNATSFTARTSQNKIVTLFCLNL